ncbi:MAG: hypothetical protein HY654_11915 [Acidobacteria bacterium]|nr:hypothetical protein [Acidobacteriota bacterium]
MLRVMHCSLRRAVGILAAAVLLGTTVMAVDLTGKWVFTVETSAGSGSPTFTFKQDGEKLAGHYSGQLGEADLTGTVKGSDVTFSFTVAVEGNTIEVTYTGKADANAIKGTVNLGGVAEGTFTGKRQ